MKHALWLAACVVGSVVGNCLVIGVVLTLYVSLILLVYAFKAWVQSP